MAGNTELSEQMVVVRALRAAGVQFCAVPNGGYRDRRGALMLRASGVQAGVPDLLIFDPPPAHPGLVGMGLEMKREGGRPSDVRPEQRAWLAALVERRWLTAICNGAADALRVLRWAGYNV